MKGNRVWSEWFKDSPNVELRPARNTNVDVWKVKPNKFIDKIKDLFPW